MTLFTDLLLGGVCLLFAYRLFFLRSHAASTRWFTAFFVMMGIGTIEGGLVNHAFFYLLGPGWKAPMVLIIGSSLTVLQLANLYTMQSLFSPRTLRSLQRIVALQILGFLLYIGRFPLEQIDFKVLHPHLGVGLVLFVGLLQGYGQSRDPHPGRRWMLLSVASLVPAGIVGATQFSPDKWFNYHDLGHVLMIPSMYFIFMAACAFSSSPAVEETPKKAGSLLEEPAVEKIPIA